MAFGDPIDDPRSFWEEARFQQVCAVCLKPASDKHQARFGKPFFAHHVVYKQFCARLREALHDTRNALRLCGWCHDKHHARNPCVSVTKLTDDNIVFVVQVYGPAAPGWLERYYDFTEPDGRVFEQLELAA